MNDRTHASTQATAPARAGNRTGPISRVYRLALVLLLGWAVIGLLGEGIAGFSEAPVPNQPILWILTALAFIGFHDAAEMWLRGRGRLAVIVAGAVLVGAAGVSLVTAGQLWDAPLTWLLYGFDLGIASLVLVAAAVSIVTGTPGCELGALSELVARFRGSYDPDVPIVHACAGGLHRLDRWESRQDRD